MLENILWTLAGWGFLLLGILAIAAIAVGFLLTWWDDSGGWRDRAKSLILLGLGGFGLTVLAVLTDLKFDLPMSEGSAWLYVARQSGPETEPDFAIRPVNRRTGSMGQAPSRYLPLRPTTLKPWGAPLNGSIEASKAADIVVVFVHGFNNTPESAHAATTALAHAWPSRLESYSAAFMSYVWASAGRVDRYEHDEAAIATVAPHLRRLVELLAGRHRVVLVAHSMGSRAVLDVLESLAHEQRTTSPFATLKLRCPEGMSCGPLFGGFPATEPPIAATVLIAPDVSVKAFTDGTYDLDALSLATKQLIVVGAPGDAVLAASAAKHGGPRAGQGPPEVRSLPGITYVDCQQCSSSNFGHSYLGPALQEVLK